ncbi:spore germination protein [Cohnella massiliensis]|uniref:spore germination protein n=1 Tax=Cohnella massiliensis TaxID=1816691 RepID=UPI001117E058|nr:spore germination protein [Cohnella massiliensis]
METTEHGPMNLDREPRPPESRGGGPGDSEHEFSAIKKPKTIEQMLRREKREEAKEEDRPALRQHHENEVPPEDRIPPRMDEWMDKLRERIGLEFNFDVQVRQMTFGDRETALLFISSLTKDPSLTEIVKRLTFLEPQSLSHDALESFFTYYLPAVQVRKSQSMSEMINDVMMGNSAFYVDGEDTVLLIDAKQYPNRNPEEPALEKVVRGSRDGFVETLLVNVALIRRRLRDPKLRFEILKVGTRTQTDVAIGYIEDIADRKLVESVRDKIQAVNIDGIPLADKQLEEMTVKTGWNPFPLVRYSERPDVVAAHLLDGSVTVIVDTSPSIMLLPTTYFDLIQHAEENRQSPTIGTYLRWVRFFGMLASVFLLPLWFLYAQNPQLRPEWLWFIGVNEKGDLPLILQFILVELGLDLLRLASVHTPAPLVTAMSLISAILIGDIAVQTGLFVNEVILYMAVAAVGMFATPSYELGFANRIVRLVLLVATFLFNAEGFVVGSTVIFVWLALMRSFNAPFMWPLVPFNANALIGVIFRRPIPRSKFRPSINRSRDNSKQPV